MQQEKAPQSESKEDDNIIIEEKVTQVNGQVTYKKYCRSQMLGQGGFAKCFEITNLETKRVSAAQIIPKNTLTQNRQRQKLISEIQIHKSLDHQYIVKFQHVFEDQENVYIVLELCKNQTLNELVKRRKRLHELEVQCYLLQIISALKYLHAHKVIHRDLKLGNLFISEQMEIQLGDFGLATKVQFEGEKKRTICGTPNYIAPEILDSKIGHSYEVDIWSLGVIIYALLIGKPPFETSDVQATYKKIKNNSYSFPQMIPISDNARNLISKIFNLDPLKRPTLDEMLDHPFMQVAPNTIPKSLPLSTLACPPSASYIKQYISQPSVQPLPTTPAPVNKLQRFSALAIETQNLKQDGHHVEQLNSPAGLNEANLNPQVLSQDGRTNYQSVDQFAVENQQSGTKKLANGGVVIKQISSTSSSVETRLNTHHGSNLGAPGGAVTPNNWVGAGGSNAYQIQGPNNNIQNNPSGVTSTQGSHNNNNNGNNNMITPISSKNNSPVFSPRPVTQGGKTFNSENSKDLKGGLIGQRNLVVSPLNQKSVHMKYQSTSNMPTTQNGGNFGSSSTGFGALSQVNSQNLQNQNSNGQISLGLGNLNVNGSTQSTEICVQSWVDYSSKYGLGYILSNGSVGVFFNDSTKIVTDVTNTYFQYLEKSTNDKFESLQFYSFSDYPPEMKKKVVLLQHFKNYLQTDGEQAILGTLFATTTQELISGAETASSNHFNLESQTQTDLLMSKNPPLVFIKKWMKTRHAIMFRLSNKVVQVNFTDQTEIMLSSENQMVIYINQKAEKSQYPLANALENNNTEMTKRLQYTKEILTHMLQNNQNFVPTNVPTN